MTEIVQAILNTSTQVWKPTEIFKAVGKLGLEGHYLFQAIDWLVEHHNLIGVFFWLIRKSFAWNGWLQSWVGDMLGFKLYMKARIPIFLVFCFGFNVYK